MLKIVLATSLLVAAAVITAEPTSSKNKQVQKLEVRKEKLGDYAQKFDKRIAAVTERMKQIDKSMESSIENTLKIFTKVKDSRETGTKVLRHKKELIEDLQDSIKLYNKMRQDVKKELKVSGVDYGKEFVNFHQWLDKKISQRIEQITKIANSFQGYKDSYDNVRSDYNSNYEYDHSYSNARDRKMARRGDKERGKTIDDMNKVIKKLTQNISKNEKELASTKSKKKLDLISLDIESDHKKITELEEAIQEILTTESDSRKIGRRAEQNISDQLKISVKRMKVNMKSFVSHFKSVMALADKRARLRYDTQKTDKMLEKVTK